MRKRDEVSRDLRPDETGLVDDEEPFRPEEEHADEAIPAPSEKSFRDTFLTLGERARRWYSETPYSREVFVGGLLGLGFIAICSKLIYLQAFVTGELAVEAAVERTARITQPHRRGSIYDRDGNVLAHSVDAVDIGIHPNQVVEVNATANLIAEVLGGDAATYAEIITRNSTFEYLSKKADPELATMLKDRLSELNASRSEFGLVELGGFEYDNTSRRVYMQGEIAGNVIGCVSSEDGSGLTGLELGLESILGGTDGYLVEERSISGAPVVGGDSVNVEPIDGENVVISLDLDIQRVAQEQLSAVIQRWSAGNGVIIVMKPDTGEILACASTPYLDLNDISNASVEAFNVRAVSDSYEPGSTFKPLTAAAAIDLGLVTPDTTYDCPATIQVGDDMVGDSDSRSYGMEMTLTEVLERSSNVGIVLCAQDIGSLNFYNYSKKFLIGENTGIDYPGEVPGLVPEYDEYTGAWASMAFGQSLAVPPIQMARAICALANGGILVQPHFLVSVGGEAKHYSDVGRAVSAQTAATVTEMLYSVVENGYGSTGKIDGYRLAGKTGTAERVDETTGLYMNNVNTASFIGYGPIDDPKVLVYVVVDYVYGGLGSDVAGPVFKVVMQEALDKLQIAPSY